MTFDFRPIEEKYPKAFAILTKWICSEYENKDQIIVSKYDGHLICTYQKSNGNVTKTQHPFNSLELDFFFDELGIMGFTFLWENPAGWGYNIAFKGYDGMDIDCLDFHFRSEALQALWLKEFEILEDRLGKGIL